MVDVLRTPEDRFRDLPGYSCGPKWVDDLKGFEGLRMHYLDEGQSDDGQVFLCLHGQPTWSYLYRRMAAVQLAAGYRVIALDYFGFGKSDKPTEEGVYTFDFHRDSLIRLVERLDLTKITLVVQDWGGLLGLTLPMDMPERFERLLVMNTALGTGDVPLGEGFLAWRAYANKNPDLDIAGLMQRACPHLTDVEAAAYAAPYPDQRYKAGVRRFPNLVPDNPDAGGAALSRRARDFWRNDWQGQSYMAIGIQDPVLGQKPMENLRKLIRNCPEPLYLDEAGHFVQEWGDKVAKAALAAFD